MRSLRGAVVLVLLALPLRAEMYRCEDGKGGLRFTSDPSACERAVVHEPQGELQRPDAAPPQAPPAAPADRPLLEIFASGTGWEVLDEPLESPVADPQLRQLGLRASQARHYTRARGPVSEVCTVELWAFESEAQASAAARAFEREGWYRVAAGALVVLAHGVRLERMVGSREGLVPGCTQLAKATQARALAP